MTLFLILILFSFMFSIDSLITTEFFTFQQPLGVFSPPITADSLPNPDPSRYAICSISLREMLYSKRSFNCGCRADCSGKWICGACDVEMRMKTNAIKVTFCAFSDPTKKITKVFETGNTKSGNWRDLSCPQGSVISKVKAKIGGKDEGINLGLNGFELTCSALDSSQTTVIKDNYPFALTPATVNSPGTYATSISVKYSANNHLTGITIFFQPNVIISQVNFIYGPLALLGLQTTKTVEIVEKLNTGTTAAIVPLSFTRNYSVTERFTPDPSPWNDLKLDGSVIMLPPALESSNTQQESIYYLKTSSIASFDTDISITYTPNKDTVIALPSCRKVVAVSEILEQRATAQYTAQLTLINSVTRNIITTVTVTGNWVGYMRSIMKTTTTYPVIEGCADE